MTIPALPAQGNTAWYAHYTALHHAVDEGPVMAVPGNFAGIDPTGAADSTAGLQAAWDAVPTGGTLVVPPGTYKVDTTVNLTGKTAAVQAMPGALFSHTTASPAFRCRNTWGTTYTVSSPSNTTTTGGGGESLETTTVTLSSSGHGYVENDIVRIFANDAVENTSALAGQYFQVLSTAGTTVVLLGRWRDTTFPSSSVRIAKAPVHRLRWRGGRFTASSALIAGGTHAFDGIIDLNGTVGALIEDVRCLAAAGPFIIARGCLDTTVVDMSVDFAQDTGTKFGYGFNDSGSEGSRLIRPRVRRVRHGYTCNSGGAAASDPNPWEYGRTFGATVVDGYAQDCSQSGWDTHGDADNITFLNCQSINCFAGFGVRGRRVRILGGIVIDGRVGVNIFSSSGGDSYGHYLGGGLIIRDVVTQSIVVSVHTAGANSGVIETRPTVIDGVFVEGRAAHPVIDATNATVWVTPGGLSVAAGGTTHVSNSNSSVIAAPQVVL